MNISNIRVKWLLSAVAFTVIGMAASVNTTSVASAQEANDGFVILFDISGSMNDPSDAEPDAAKIDVAKNALKEAVLQLEPGSVDIGLRSFSGCGADDSTLVSSPRPVDPDALASEIDGLQADGRTGIETALRDSVNDLSGRDGEKVILLISDGEETCGGDPCTAMSQIVDSGVSVVVNTIGFQTAGTSAEPQLKCIADTTGGSSISVTNSDEIADAIIGSVETPDATCTGDLAECFAPELRFHPDETHFPMNPSSWLSQSELKWAADSACPNPVVTVQGELTASNLNNHIWFEEKGLIPSFCESTDRKAEATDFTAPFSQQAANGQQRPTYDDGSTLSLEEGFYINHVTGDDKNSALENVPTFYAITEHGGFTEINYWTFYGFDPKSTVASAIQHQGDWEHIVVLVDSDRSLHSVRYYGHGCDDPFDLLASDPNLMLVDETHPVVLVARGSHASWPHERGLGITGWPGCGISGTTDETAVSGGKVLRSWESGVVEATAQDWYGFGGRWGDTALSGVDNKHGPVGLPFSISAEYLPFTDAPISSSDAGRLQTPAKVRFEPLDIGEFTFVDGLPGRSFVAVLESLPTVVGSGYFDSSGKGVASFFIPQATSPGLHRVVARDAKTGEVLGAFPISIEVPAACLSSDKTSDQDGDGLADVCDTNSADGPDADYDGDGVANGADNCPTVVNPGQVADGARTVGNACNSVLGANPVPSYPVKLVAEPAPPPTPTPTPPPPPTYIVCPEKAEPFDSNGDGVDDQCSASDFGIVHTPDGLLDEVKPLIDLSAVEKLVTAEVDGQPVVAIGFTG